MKKIFLYIIAITLVLSACKKKEVLDVDMNKYNTDFNVENNLDRWIATNITTPYNIEIIYRFNRNLTDVSKDISPVDIDKVQPVLEAVLNNYLKPYEKVAGKAFIKTLCPKQYVLYGSVSYNSNGSVQLATAEGGRKVVFYDVNNFKITDLESESGVRRKIRTMHHEFTHILNQNVIIPPEFSEITKADYYSDWTNATQNSAEIAKSLGFVSRYARMVYTEDFAEMTAHLLVMGQVWFNNYVISAPIDAQKKLRRKEELVVQYFQDAFGINFRTLQAEVQNALKTIYGAQDPVDLSQTFQTWLAQNKVNTLTYDPAAAHYTTYGKSATFTTMFTNYTTLAGSMSNANKIRTMALTFPSATMMTLNVTFTQGTGTTVYTASYDFDMTVNAPANEITFAKRNPDPTTSAYNNGKLSGMLSGFETYLLPYFTNRVFVADFLPATLPSTSPLYKTFAGFSEKGNSANYFYGPIVLK
ncbi:substrate import-associated zinc metallohydrolase lipoprotein [Pedobacter montanisoli]|uniref:Zinc-binding metallopeptidase n=1 Tax=Pedobacter montanisoli TaxID=2923277 RepID=A0ABS9ZRM2_9SPHI|nr:substrate import-associated zinc metallohydrolase lipoprotein [Pedobacter montanisoli]MCJ0741241.1 putative zinc-binding metallopeptidase [Pedobacter montanisoli]